MDQLLESIVALLVLWRMVVGALIGAGVALLVSRAFQGIPSGAWFAITFVGMSAGLVWHMGVLSAREAAAGARQQHIAKPIAFVSIAVVAGIWGAVVASVTGIAVALLAIAVAPTALGWLFCRISGSQLTLSQAGFATMASFIGFAAPYAIHSLFISLGA